MTDQFAKQMPSTVGQKHYRAWRLDHISTGFGKTWYGIVIFLPIFQK